MCPNAVYGNAASRISESGPSNGTFAYGDYPDVDALYREQAQETDTTRRAQLPQQIQQLLHERVRFAPIFEYIWPSAVDPSLADPALMLIDPYLCCAPLEEVRLNK